VAELTLAQLKASAKDYTKLIGGAPIPELYGVTDGKAVGTYVEQNFHLFLRDAYSYIPGSAASGIDFPELQVDLKVTSIKQPQSSCPFRDASQKVYGLGYDLLVLIYEKIDDHENKGAILDFKHGVFVDRSKTADYQTTYGLKGILERGGNRDDIVAFLDERNLPLDEIGREQLADRILEEPPKLGYLTVSNALQWRLQYSRVIGLASALAVERPDGVENLLE